MSSHELPSELKYATIPQEKKENLFEFIIYLDF